MALHLATERKRERIRTRCLCRPAELEKTKLWSKYPQQTAKINNTPEEGTLQKVAWYDVERLQRFAESCEYRNQLYNEQTDQDKTRFADLKPVNLELTVQPEKEKAISDKLIGVSVYSSKTSTMEQTEAYTPNWYKTATSNM